MIRLRNFGILWPLLLAGAMAWLLFTRDLAGAWTVMAGADWALAGLAFVLSIAGLYLRVFNWSQVVSFTWGRPPFHRLCLGAFTGYLCNLVFPIRVGALIQAWLAHIRAGINPGLALGAIAVIRVTDVGMLAVLGILGLAFSPDTPMDHLLWPILGTLGILGASGTLGLFFLTRQPRCQEWLKARLTALMPDRFKSGGQTALAGLWEGLGIFRHPWRLGRTALLSGLFWCLAGTQVFFLLKAFHPDLADFFPALTLTLAQVLALAIPAPANVGPYHGATAALLHAWGVPLDRALMSAVAMHAVMTLGNGLPGLIYAAAYQTPVLALYRTLKKRSPID